MYEFKMALNIAKVVKNICFAKSAGAINHCTITRSLKTFREKRLTEQVWLYRYKTMDADPTLQVIETNPVNITWRVSGDL